MNGSQASIALVRFPHPASSETLPLQAFFAAHTAELHVCVARSTGWLGSNRVGAAEPEQGAGVIAFASPAGVLQVLFVDRFNTLRRLQRQTGEDWSQSEPVSMPPAPSGAALTHGRLGADNDFVVLIDSAGRVTSLRINGSAAGPQLEPLPSGTPLAIPGGSVVAFNQSSGILSVVFCVSEARRLHVIWRSEVDTRWQGPAPIDANAPAAAVPTGALAAGLLGDNQWFVIHVADDGALRAARVVGTASWNTPQAISIAGFAPPGAPVATLQQATALLCVFVVDEGGAVQRFWRTESDSAWSGPSPLTVAGAARPGANLAAAKQSGDESVLVFVGADGRPWICWTFGDGPWNGPALISQYRAAEPFVPSSAPSAEPSVWAPLPASGERIAATQLATRFESWLTGPGSVNGRSFYTGADLGANTEHRGSGDSGTRLIIFFGDTTVSESAGLHDPALQPPFDSDMIGIIEAPAITSGMPMAIVPGPASTVPGQVLPDESFQPYTLKRCGTLGSLETPTGAFSHGGRVYVFAEVNGKRPVCYLTSAAQPESNTPFELHFEISRKRFIQVAPWVVTNRRHPGLPSTSGDGVVMIGRGADPPEPDGHFLAWMPLSAERAPRFEDLLFYAGVEGNQLRWSAREAEAVAIAGPTPLGYSSVSLNWIAGPDLWVLVYTRAKNSSDPNPARNRLGPIVARLSKALHTWSDEISLFDPVRDLEPDDPIQWHDDSWAYGPFLLGRFHLWDPVSATLTLRYLMSTKNPYQVHVRSSDLAVATPISEHIFCRTADDRLLHLWWSSETGRVESEDWSTPVLAPALAGDPAVIATIGRLSAFYRDAAGGLAHVFRDLPSGDLHLATASATQLPQAAAGDPAVLETPGQLHVFYRGVSGSLQHLARQGLPCVGPDVPPRIVCHCCGTGCDSDSCRTHDSRSLR